MLSSDKLKRCRKVAGMSITELASALTPAGLAAEKAQKRTKELKSALGNWERGLLKPQPSREDIESLARALHVGRTDLVCWNASHKFAPMAPRKVRLMAELIRGRSAQDALDVLKFANKRAAVFIDKVLRSAIASADEEEADVEGLFVSEARVDEGGIRRGTRRWRPKDRGRAVSFTRLASHIHVSVDVG